MRSTSSCMKRLMKDSVVKQVLTLDNTLLLAYIRIVAKRRIEELGLEKIRDWIDKAINSKVEARRLLAQVLAHHFLGMKSDDPKFPYAVANAFGAVQSYQVTYMSRVMDLDFDLARYVAEHTHYTYEEVLRGVDK